MPHLVTHRPRLTNLRSNDETDGSHKVWETFSAFSYELGGVMFVIGSVCFFPALSSYMAAGDWLFIVGSILYLLVTGHELLEVHKYWRRHGTQTFADRIEFVAAWSYVLGSVLFVIGSVCFLPAVDAIVPGAWMFIVGSALFFIGGLVNILQVVEAPSLIYMQLFNFTVALFVIGSALFAEASIPYLWHLGEPARSHMSNFDAAQYVFGSVLFLIGGMAIYYRKLVRDKLEAFCHTHGLGTMFISALKSEIHDKARLGKRVIKQTAEQDE